MTERIDAIEGRVARLEDAFENGIGRIEALIRSEIKGLKDEQIADLRKANERIADDQRRIWEMIHAIQLDRMRQVGSERTSQRMTHVIVNLITAASTGVISSIATWWATRH